MKTCSFAQENETLLNQIRLLPKQIILMKLVMEYTRNLSLLTLKILLIRTIYARTCTVDARRSSYTKC